MSKEAYVKTPMRVVDHPDSDGLFVRVAVNSKNTIFHSDSYQVAGKWAISLSDRKRKAVLLSDFTNHSYQQVWLHVPDGILEDVLSIFKNNKKEGIFEVGPDGEEEQVVER